MIAKSNKKINPKKSENLLEGYSFYKGMESKFIDLVHLIGGALIYNHFPKELTEHRVRRLYNKHPSGRKYLPISLPKIVEITGISLGGLQRIFNHIEKLELIERIYAKETHDRKECKLLGLTDEGIEYFKRLIKQYDSRFKPEKIITQKVYNYKPNINLKKGLTFKKHNESKTANLLRVYHKYDPKELITASTGKYIHAAYNLIYALIEQELGEKANDKKAYAYFCAYTEHQAYYLNNFNLHNAYSFKAIQAFFKAIKSKNFKWLGRSKEILFDLLSTNQPMCYAEVKKQQEKFHRPKRTLPPELEEPKAEKKQLQPQKLGEIDGFCSFSSVFDKIFKKQKREVVNKKEQGSDFYFRKLAKSP